MFDDTGQYQPVLHCIILYAIICHLYSIVTVLYPHFMIIFFLRSNMVKSHQVPLQYSLLFSRSYFVTKNSHRKCCFPLSLQLPLMASMASSSAPSIGTQRKQSCTGIFKGVEWIDSHVEPLRLALMDAKQADSGRGSSALRGPYQLHGGYGGHWVQFDGKCETQKAITTVVFTIHPTNMLFSQQYISRYTHKHTSFQKTNAY